MKHLNSWLSTTFAVMMVFGAMSIQSFAATAEAKIGIVDMQLALQTVDSGKKAKAHLEAELKKKEKEIAAEEAALKKEAEQFQKTKVGMTGEAAAKKQTEIQQKIMKFQEKRYKTQNELQQKEREMTAPIIGKLREIIKNVANKKGYTVILEKNENNVLFSRDKDEITAEVISIYNKQNKS